MNFDNILFENRGGIATLTINRPSKLNALNRATIQELHEAFSAAEIDEEVKVIILTGSGEKAFVAGADISEFADFSTEEGKNLAAEGQRLLFDFVSNFSKPVIAAINGFALGGGLELAMAAGREDPGVRESLIAGDKSAALEGMSASFAAAGGDVIETVHGLGYRLALP